MKTLTAYLHLSQSNSEHTRDRCPGVVFALDNQEIGTLPADSEQPHLPLADASVEAIVVLDDTIGRVIDEEAWLAELQRVLVSGGTLSFTLPKTGMLAWLNAMDAHRYAVDIGKRGDTPDASLPTGWSRHYSRDEVRSLCTGAGFELVEMRTISYVPQEARMIAGLFWRNWVRGDRDAERDLWPRFGRRDPRDATSWVGTTWSVVARKRS